VSCCSRIVNNTVLDPNDERPGPPWIQVAAHKDGTESEDVIVRNDLVTDLSLEGPTVTEDHNRVIEDAAALFVDPPWDVHLLEGAPPVDTGSDDLAPVLDADRIARPQGAGIDLGACEWHEEDVGPVDAGPGDVDGGSGGDRDAGGSSGSDGGGTGADAGAAGADDDGGCGCMTVGSGFGGGWIAAGFALLGLLALRRRSGR